MCGCVSLCVILGMSVCLCVHDAYATAWIHIMVYVYIHKVAPIFSLQTSVIGIIPKRMIGVMVTLWHGR